MQYIARKQQHGYGRPLGILVLKERIPCPPGTPGNPTTFPFPVIYECIEGVTASQLRNANDPGGLAAFLSAARVLVDKGVRAILGGCGLMIVHQHELARAMPIPVLSSSLLQLPLIAATLDPEARIGVIASSHASLSEEHLALSGIARDRAVLAGMDGKRCFTAAVMQEGGVLDFEGVRDETIALARAMVADHPRIAAVLLECVDLPPYAAALQEAIGLPVFDITTLATWGASGVRRSPFNGDY
ncbi:MAG TPA: hypothetical protein VMF03_00610 [Steroidobacteraceae bacterium]|nr:hypothetical protein [Steroidobacteraceae bacterium]